jgi:hypothetical protein
LRLPGGHPTARYQRCNIGDGYRLFRYDHFANGELVGSLSGVIEGGVLDCGHSAPFGGIDLVHSRERVSEVVALLHSVLARAKSNGIRVIRIRARPGYFGDNEASLAFALLQLGAWVESCELSLGIETGHYLTAEQYLSSLRYTPRRLVRLALGSGLVFEPAVAPAEWGACFDLLGEVKKRRGVVLKISLEYVQKLAQLFGSRIVMHRVIKDDALAGAVLVYRVAPEWDYIVAWGDSLRHRHHSVMNFIVYQLVRLAIADRVTVVDLGISSVDGVADDGLIHFKRSVGAVTGVRTVYRLEVP